jgi:hypothetical protein
LIDGSLACEVDDQGNMAVKPNGRLDRLNALALQAIAGLCGLTDPIDEPCLKANRDGVMPRRELHD